MLGVNNIFYFLLIQGNYISQKNSPKPIHVFVSALKSFPFPYFEQEIYRNLLSNKKMP